LVFNVADEIEGQPILAPDARGPTTGTWATKGEPEGSLLTINDLSVDFVSVDGRVNVLNSISMHAEKGEVIGLVGESGSGKSTLGLATIGLLDTPPAHLIGGSIIFEGTDLTELDSEGMYKIRGTGIGMIFQESLAALNPVYRTETQLRESLEVMKRARSLNLDGGEEQSLLIKTLTDLHIDKPEIVLRKYPHELSGGMRQRISIAMSIIEKPRLLILDEVTTGLDVYVQNRILSLLKDLNTRMGVTMILITHDLAVASQICDRLYVMYAGRLMEVGRSNEVLNAPLHPYTQKLMAAVPQGFKDAPLLPAATGEPPELANLPQGCKFNPRCPKVMDICREKEPQMFEVSSGRYASCWLYGENNG
jgi:oligopeptide/dipeptide ABC transporter ATP-binding protein